jgi:hypothetical protein
MPDDDMPHTSPRAKAKDRAAVKDAERKYGKPKPDTQIRNTSDLERLKGRVRDNPAAKAKARAVGGRKPKARRSKKGR